MRQLMYCIVCLVSEGACTVFGVVAKQIFVLASSLCSLKLGDIFELVSRCGKWYQPVLQYGNVLSNMSDVAHYSVVVYPL